VQHQTKMGNCGTALQVGDSTSDGPRVPVLFDSIELLSQVWALVGSPINGATRETTGQTERGRTLPHGEPERNPFFLRRGGIKRKGPKSGEPWHHGRSGGVSKEGR